MLISSSSSSSSFFSSLMCMREHKHCNSQNHRKKHLTFDGCLCTHIATVWIGVISPFIASLSLSLSSSDAVVWYFYYYLRCRTRVISVSYLCHNGVIFAISCHNFLKINRIVVSYLYWYVSSCLCPCILDF